MPFDEFNDIVGLDEKYALDAKFKIKLSLQIIGLNSLVSIDLQSHRHQHIKIAIDAGLRMTLGLNSSLSSISISPSPPSTPKTSIK